MRVFSSSVVVVGLALAAGWARADGLLYQLPEDGTWVRYKLDTVGKMGQEEAQGSGFLRIASVGRTTDKEEPCRWIEVSLHAKVKIAGGREGTHKLTAKVLIPEKYLKEGESPLDHVVRGWYREGEPERESEPRKLNDPKDVNRTQLPIVLAGPLKEVRQLQEVVVESKLGKLSCGGLTGRMELKIERGSTLDVTLENRLHPKAPFGVVTSHWTLQTKDDGNTVVETTWDFELSDFGGDAKSELPDKQ